MISTWTNTITHFLLRECVLIPTTSNCSKWTVSSLNTVRGYTGFKGPCKKWNSRSTKGYIFLGQNIISWKAQDLSLQTKKKTVCVSAVLRLVYHYVREWGRGSGEEWNYNDSPSPHLSNFIVFRLVRWWGTTTIGVWHEIVFQITFFQISIIDQEKKEAFAELFWLIDLYLSLLLVQQTIPSDIQLQLYKNQKSQKTPVVRDPSRINLVSISMFTRSWQDVFRLKK